MCFVRLLCADMSTILPKGDIMDTVLALDVGEKRIGIAGSDALGMTAQPIETLHRSNTHDDITRILALVKERRAAAIVMGLPLNMDGTRGFQAECALAFARLVRDNTGTPILMVDERLTTKSAHGALIEGNVSREKRKGIVDRVAAVYILETYLAAPAQGRKLEEYE